MQPALDSVEIVAARITTRFAAIAASSLRSSGRSADLILQAPKRLRR